jgi:hypothetical protein
MSSMRRVQRRQPQFVSKTSARSVLSAHVRIGTVKFTIDVIRDRRSPLYSASLEAKAKVALPSSDAICRRDRIHTSTRDDLSLGVGRIQSTRVVRQRLRFAWLRLLRLTIFVVFSRSGKMFGFRRRRAGKIVGKIVDRRSWIVDSAGRQSRRWFRWGTESGGW